MPPEISVGPVLPVAAVAADPRPAAKQDQPATTLSPPMMYPNPSMHIDPELGMVVIEYHGADGKVTGSLPTARQLDAYRMTMQVPPDSTATPQAADETAAAELAATV